MVMVGTAQIREQKKWDGESTELSFGQIQLRVRHGARALKCGSSMTTHRPNHAPLEAPNKLAALETWMEKVPLSRRLCLTSEHQVHTTDIVCRADVQSNWQT